ncbi:hypothetical protein EVAR_39497_1 [Eumeta japonica]|uniref:Uncharacterized protein n=1 Tax=Eumeta variegata TaxID=151549 RepID=A0A4C1W2Z7_EUMVA|nr:hypothetical protein EVAR_39497_1 [Eumeta japonica]
MLMSRPPSAAAFDLAVGAVNAASFGRRARSRAALWAASSAQIAACTLHFGSHRPVNQSNLFTRPSSKWAAHERADHATPEARALRGSGGYARLGRV